ncbi:MAG: hypothetical protein M1828_003725 [Chrysothrix sp. TS-e1954]|nr:MAG: hypothetical protein M1828_003725 [Chrysothrix sp. TS-e1954]
MERELSALRAKLADKEPSETSTPPQVRDARAPTTANLLSKQRNNISAMHQGVADSLLDLHHSSNANSKSDSKRLGSAVLTSDQVNDLFEEYFKHYHPYLPLLDTQRSPEYFFELSELLFWSIIAVASRRWAEDPTLLTGLATSLNYLVWETVAAVPQNYHVVKALCILCTWPLPTKSSTTDPTFMLAGLMMQIAMQTGLHRPSSTRDFTKTQIEWRDEDVRDRLKTWAACNIVSQNVSTGYGQPPNSHYDYALIHEDLPSEIYWRLRIERFANQVSTFMYQRSRDPAGITDELERPSWVSIMAQTYRELEREISKRNSLIETLYLRAAWLHCTLSAFFDSPNNPDYIRSLLKLYFAARDFLQTVIDLCRDPAESGADTSQSSTTTNEHNPHSTSMPKGSLANPTSMRSLKFAGFYIMQMILAGGFTLMKLLNSFFATHIDIAASRWLFNQTVRVVRAASINNNDLPSRLAEVLAQLWRSSGAGMKTYDTEDSQIDSSLQLKVRCRMSMSLVFDSVWRWREQSQFGSGDGARLDPSNPTRLDSTPAPGDTSTPSNGRSSTMKRNLTSAATSSQGTFVDPALMDDSVNANTSSNGLTSSIGAPGPGLDVHDGLVDLSYDVFDPLTWMLDGGGLDFPYNDLSMEHDDTTGTANTYFNS